MKIVWMYFVPDIIDICIAPVWFLTSV